MPTAQQVNRELTRRFSKWLLAHHYSRSTWLRYSRSVEDFRGFLGKRGITKATHFDVQEHLAVCARKGASARAVRYELCALRLFFDFLNLGGLVMWCPPRMVRLPRFQPTLPMVMTVKQVFKLLGAAREGYERTLLEVFYGTGCRTGEVRTMRIEDIDFARRRIRVNGKRGERFVLFPERVARALRRYLGRRREGYVFVDSKPVQSLNPMPGSSGGWRCRWRRYNAKGEWVGIGNAYVPVGKRWGHLQAKRYFAELARADFVRRPRGLRPLCIAAIQKVVVKVGLRVGLDVHPYVLRHSLATHLLDNGADIRVIQEMLGHSSIKSTQVYTHVSKEKIKRTFDDCHPLGKGTYVDESNRRG